MEQPATSVTVNELQELVDSWARLRQEIDEIEDIGSEKQKLKKELEVKLQAIMQELQLDKFVGKLGVKVEMREIQYVNMPQSPEATQEFFEYLKSLGQFDLMATVHYQKLQSWFKSHMEEQGLKPIPGLEPAKTRYEIRKGR